MTSRPHLIQRLFNHGYSESVGDIITKLLTIDAESVNYWSNKVSESKQELLCSYIKAQLAHPNTQSLPQRLNCINNTIVELIEQSEGKYDGEKYK